MLNLVWELNLLRRELMEERWIQYFLAHGSVLDDYKSVVLHIRGAK